MTIPCAFCAQPFKAKPGYQYCSRTCARRARSLATLQLWLSGEDSGCTPYGEVREQIRTWLFEQNRYQCSKCFWGETNPKTGKVPLQINHIDGNYRNCSKENLQVLCPNCHSLTPNFGALNKGNGRDYRYKKDISEPA